jgi:hypothetical protein
MINEAKNEEVRDKESTIPSTIELEKQINPFMRIHSIMYLIGQNEPIEALGKLREMKDSFQ